MIPPTSSSQPPSPSMRLPRATKRRIERLDGTDRVAELAKNDPVLLAMIEELQARGIPMSALLAKPRTEKKGVVGLEGGLEHRSKTEGNPARDTLIGFARQMIPTYQAGRMHYVLANALERAYRTATGTLRDGEKPCRRLVITTPPQHGKSELASRLFPAWCLGQNPNISMILASYSADLAELNSGQAKAYVTSSAYHDLFPDIRLRHGSRSSALWRLQGYKGAVRGAGVGGGLTGFPANIFLIDDPIKDRQEADSPLVRETVWNWYKSVARTRLQGDAGVMIIIMTRWHKEDLVGKLLSLQGTDELSDQWEVVHLKALAEEHNPEDPNSSIDPLGRAPGEPLWPEKFSEQFYKEARANSESDWDCLWQGNPKPQAGNLFNRDNFKKIKRADLPPFIPDTTDDNGNINTKLPPGFTVETERLIRVCRHWDLAISIKEKAAWTVGSLVGLSNSGKIYIIDVIRYREEWPESRKRVKEAAMRDGTPVVLGIEGVAFQSAAVQEMRADPDLVAFIIRSTTPGMRDKKDRAIPWATRADAGLVYVVEGKWNQEFFSEVDTFPTGTYADQVDSVSGAIEILGVRGAHVVSSVSVISTPPETLVADSGDGDNVGRFGVGGYTGTSPLDRIAYGGKRGTGDTFTPTFSFEPPRLDYGGVISSLRVHKDLHLGLPPNYPHDVLRGAIETMPEPVRSEYLRVFPELQSEADKALLKLV